MTNRQIALMWIGAVLLAVAVFWVGAGNALYLQKTTPGIPSLITPPTEEGRRIAVANQAAWEAERTPNWWLGVGIPILILGACVYLSTIRKPEPEPEPDRKDGYGVF